MSPCKFIWTFRCGSPAYLSEQFQYFTDLRFAFGRKSETESSVSPLFIKLMIFFMKGCRNTIQNYIITHFVPHKNRKAPTAVIGDICGIPAHITPPPAPPEKRQLRRSFYQCLEIHSLLRSRQIIVIFHYGLGVPISPGETPITAIVLSMPCVSFIISNDSSYSLRFF